MPEFDPTANEILDENREAMAAAEGDGLLERHGLTGRVFFAESGEKFWMQDASGGWRGRSEKLFRDYLKRIGVNAVRDDKAKMSELDNLVLHISLNCAVDYAGPLAGYQRGFMENNGQPTLVTRSFQIPDQAKGKFDIIKAAIDQQLGPTEADGIDQRDYLFGWWKHSLECLLNGYKKNLGMCLTLAGARGCGKTIIKTLIRDSLGGREKQVYKFLSGQTQFNGGLEGFECWTMDDDQSQTDARMRDSMAAKIKKIVADPVYQIEPKNKQAFDLEIFRRLIICVNDEPEKLLVLPQLTDDLVDKILVLRCKAPLDPNNPMPMPTVTPLQQDAFGDKLREQLPAFMYWLLNEYEIPKDLYGRFGIKHFQHPEIRRHLFELSPLVPLMDMIYRVLFDQKLYDYWQGTVSQLRVALLDKDAPLTSREQSSVRGVNWFGSQLKRIHEEHPERYEMRKCASGRIWHIARSGKILLDAAPSNYCPEKTDQFTE